MRDARVEEVEHVSDSDSEEREDIGQSQARLTVAIYPGEYTYPLNQSINQSLTFHCLSSSSRSNVFDITR